MRYIEIDNIEFTNEDGNTFTIKDRRPIPNYTILTTIKKNNEELADEIAVRREVYGEFAETLSYRIHEANIVKLIENRFDFSKLKEIKIPTIED
jgi:hypothetical protein